LWCIGYRNQVVDHDVIAECLKTVSKSGRNIKLVSPIARKLELQPPAISRGLGSDIDDDVPYATLNTTHNFYFAVRLPLIVHASKGALAS